MVVIPVDLQATTTVESGGRRIVWITGELDLSTAPVLGSVVESAIRAPDTSEIILDLEDLTFLDASGIRMLVSCVQLAQLLGRSLRARNSHDEVDMILRLVGVAELIHLPEIPSAGSVSPETGS